VNDFETVRKGLEVNAHEAAQALDRIEAEVERLRTVSQAEDEAIRVGTKPFRLLRAHPTVKAYVERREAEIERLRAAQAEAWDEVEVQHREVERLRGEQGTEVALRAMAAEAEVERLRAALEPFIWSTTPVRAEENYMVHVKGNDILRGRAALAKEEA
jgi:hypothetical protein